jgi:uncharacterized protein YyaL (SSP411 family)
MMKENNLSSETSLYLLQHAKNPVHWQPWSDHVFDYAKQSGKLVLVSIGYSACHWCHVMEHESFENDDVAQLMNQHFINVKVDREERPDVDKLYMSAIQLMGVQGGWPLNCILMPDGRPIYGGTYFTKEKWLEVLKALVLTYEEQPARVEAFAKEIQENLEDKAYEHITASFSINKETLQDWMVKLKRTFDLDFGGYQYVPKFPLPNHLDFLLEYGFQEQDGMISQHLRKTLTSMGNGGIYDHIGGGFSRYSTDAVWKVPHFEKMLYDNAQLLGLYSKAALFSDSKYDSEFYRSIVNETFIYLRRSLKTRSGSYLCAQDADSDGAEGLYYCWRKEELKMILGPDFNWFKDFYYIRNDESWEDGLFILQRKQELKQLAANNKWSINQAKENVNRVKRTLAFHREKREEPIIDPKSLTAWNALLINGLSQAYLALNDESFIEEAVSIANWIINRQLQSKGALYRNYVNDISSINGFLDDYALTIEAFIKLYQIKGDLCYLEHAKKMGDYVLSEFYSEEQGLFFYIEKGSKLIARKIDIDDDVIPSSNSVMAHNLQLLGVYFRKEDWVEKSHQMLGKILAFINKYPSGYLNWMALYYRLFLGIKEIHVLTGAIPTKADLSALIRSNRVVSYHKEIPMSSAYKETGIYLCENKVCLPKIASIKTLLEELKN